MIARLRSQPDGSDTGEVRRAEENYSYRKRRLVQTAYGEAVVDGARPRVVGYR